MAVLARRAARPEYCALVVITVTAAILRFWNLPQRGLLYWDEAKFALEGERMHAALLALARMHVQLDAGKAVGTAKPTHALLVGISFLVFGDHDWAALAVPAACSTASTVLVYFVGRKLFSPAVALTAAAFFAVSEYEAVYARSVLSESDATAVFLIATVLWLGSLVDRHPRSIGHLTWAAALFGLAFTVNYRLLVYVAVVVAIDLAYAYPRIRVAGAGARALAWCCLFIAPGLWQLVGMLGAGHGLYFFRNELTGAPSSYWSEALYQVHGGKQAVLRFSPLPYLQWFEVRQGPLASALVVVGLATALVRRTLAWTISASLVILPYAAYVFAPFIVPRNMEATLPFASLLAAAACAQIANVFRPVAQRRLVFWVLISAVVGMGTWMSWRLTPARSGFSGAAAYVRTHGQRSVLTTSEDMLFYFRGSSTYCDAPALPLKFSSMKWYVGAGYRYVAIERHRTGVADYVRSHAPLVATFLITGPVHVGENLINSENAHPPNGADPPDHVLMYDIRKLRLPGWVHSATRPPACSRDVVT